MPLPIAVSAVPPRHRSAARRRIVGAAACLLIGPLTFAADPVSVTTQTFASVATTAVFSAPATVTARHDPDMAAQIEGQIVAMPVEVGDTVAEGDVLVRLDCRRFEAALDSARAEVERARALQTFAAAQLTRARDLKRKDSISDELLDQRRTDLATARADRSIREARLRQAEIDVAHCELRAPFAWVVPRRHASVGSYASRGMVIVSLIQTRGQEVSVALRRGQAESLAAARAISLDINGTVYALRLRTLLPYYDTTTRTREARLVFRADTAPSGSAGRVLWQGSGRLLPADLMVRRGGRIGVFVLDGDTARFHPLPGAQDGQPVAADLAPDTPLIADGRQRLDDGDRVQRLDDGG